MHVELLSCLQSELKIRHELLGFGKKRNDSPQNESHHIMLAQHSFTTFEGEQSRIVNLFQSLHSRHAHVDDGEMHVLHLSPALFVSLGLSERGWQRGAFISRAPLQPSECFRPRRPPRLLLWRQELVQGGRPQRMNRFNLLGRSVFGAGRELRMKWNGASHSLYPLTRSEPPGSDRQSPCREGTRPCPTASSALGAGARPANTGEGVSQRE